MLDKSKKKKKTTPTKKKKHNKTGKRVVSKNTKDFKNKTKKNKKTNKVNNKTSKNKTKISKQKKTKMLVLTIFIVLSLLAINGAYYILKTPKFNISTIVITGNKLINEEDILESSNIKKGDNILKSYFKIDKEKIENIPYIKSVKVSFNLPSNFNIKVKERISIYFAYDKEKDVYYRIDEEGVILEICNTIELKASELLVTGITFDDEIVLGSKINDIDFSKLLIYEEIENEFNKVFKDEIITKVNFQNSLTTIYLNDKIEVILPNGDNLQYNLTFLKEILGKVVDVKGTIDMTKDNPTFISF